MQQVIMQWFDEDENRLTSTFIKFHEKPRQPPCHAVANRENSSCMSAYLQNNNNNRLQRRSVLSTIPDNLAVYKSGTGIRGRGHWDVCVGTYDLGLGDARRGTPEDIKYGMRGCVGRRCGDVKYRDAGDAKCE